MSKMQMTWVQPHDIGFEKTMSLMTYAEMFGLVISVCLCHLQSVYNSCTMLFLELW